MPSARSLAPIAALVAVAVSPAPGQDPSLAVERPGVSRGGWGTLQATPVRIRLPEEMIPADPLPIPPWVFGSSSGAPVAEALRRAGVDAEAARELLAAGRVADGALRPSAEQILALAPEVRARLYDQLRRVPANSNQQYPTKLPRDRLGARLAGLAPSTRRLLERLVYQRRSAPGSWLLADLPALTWLVRDRQERRHAIQAVSQRDSVLLRVLVDEASDVEALAAWWGRGGRRRELETLLRSVQQVEGGYPLDVLYLLPPLVRTLAYTYPLFEQAEQRDCFWTVLNFFTAAPDDTLDAGRIQRALSRLQPVSGPLRLGDVMLLASRGDLVHAAVYVADDVYFTKNGGHFSVPWLFMRRGDLLELYDELDAGGVGHFRDTGQD